MNNTLPYQLGSILTKQNRNVRSCHSAFFLKPPRKANLESSKSCIRYSIPTLINNFDHSFIGNLNTMSILSLKSKFKKMTIENYKFNCMEPNCYPCCSRFFNTFGFSGSLRYLHINHYLNNFIFQHTSLYTGFFKYLNILDYFSLPIEN